MLCACQLELDKRTETTVYELSVHTFLRAMQTQSEGMLDCSYFPHHFQEPRAAELARRRELTWLAPTHPTMRLPRAETTQ